jgi:hypothetical protein
LALRNVLPVKKSRGRWQSASVASAVAFTVLAFGVAVGAACGGTTDAKDPKADRLCTPGSYVYCRCEDRSDGTKLCNSDGMSFRACVCDGQSSGELPIDWDGGLEPIDAGPVDPGAARIDDACKDRLGVVAGDNTSLDVYVATYKGGGAFQVSKSTGPALRETPTVVNVGPALVATWYSRFSSIVWSKMLAGTWSSPEGLGSAPTSRGTTAAPYAGGSRLVYVDDMSNLRFGVYGATGWGDVTGFAGTASPDAGADGKGDPTAATPSDGTVLVAWATQSGAVQSRSLSVAGNWLAPKTLVQSGAFSGPISVGAIEGSATEDALVVYADENLLLRGLARDLGSKSWKAPVLVDSAATAIEHRLIGLPGGRAMLVYLGSNDAPYVSIYKPGSGFSAPVEMLPGTNPPLKTAPVLAKGRCGSDVTAVYALKSTGAVKVVRYVSGTWNGPYDVPGIPASSWAAIGETP